MVIWQANNDIVALLNEVKEKHHARLENANIALAFSDSKAFIKDRLNLGKVSKFNAMNKLFQGTKFDFVLVISFDMWSDVLTAQQREALLDLHLTRCSLQYIPVEVETNGKKTKVLDDKGRVQYTTDPKLNEAGEIQWVVLPLDLPVFSDNIRRYGLWYDEMEYVKEAVDTHEQS